MVQDSKDKVPYEFSRKAIHLFSLLVPVGVYYSLNITKVALIFFILFYSYSEWKKIKGKKFFAHKWILKFQRENEKTIFAKAPVFLAAGILMAITLFTFPAIIVGIYQVGVSDTMASFVGTKWGQKGTHIPLAGKKTLTGSLAFVVSALPVCLYYLEPSRALVVALCGAFLEALPFQDWDNLLIPIIVTFLTGALMF